MSRFLLGDAPLAHDVTFTVLHRPGEDGARLLRLLGDKEAARGRLIALAHRFADKILGAALGVRRRLQWRVGGLAQTRRRARKDVAALSAVSLTRSASRPKPVEPERSGLPRSPSPHRCGAVGDLVQLLGFGHRRRARQMGAQCASTVTSNFGRRLPSAERAIRRPCAGVPDERARIRRARTDASAAAFDLFGLAVKFGAAVTAPARSAASRNPAVC